MSNIRVYWLHTLSPTHVGAGRGVGYIDLPIHRDKVTNWPLVPGSAFKGVWADRFKVRTEGRSGEAALAFGKASDQENGSNAGALVPTDARLVCLPIRSFKGTFAWCSSPMSLELLRRDLAMAKLAGLPAAPATLAGETIHHPEKTCLADKPDSGPGRIYLEDLDFQAKVCPTANAWAHKLAEWVFPQDSDKSWRERFIERFAVVPDTVFDYFTETGTEVVARVRIDDDKKTVKEGQLWNEESLPAETILAGLVSCERVFGNEQGVTAESLLNKYASGVLPLQIGGKATVGRGRVRCVFTSNNGGAQ